MSLPENINKLPNPEKHESHTTRAARLLGKLALRTTEIVLFAGATYGSQELIFHDSLPLSVNVALAGGAAAAIHLSANTKK